MSTVVTRNYPDYLSLRTDICSQCIVLYLDFVHLPVLEQLVGTSSYFYFFISTLPRILFDTSF